MSVGDLREVDTTIESAARQKLGGHQHHDGEDDLLIVCLRSA